MSWEQVGPYLITVIVSVLGTVLFWLIQGKVRSSRKEGSVVTSLDNFTKKFDSFEKIIDKRFEHEAKERKELEGKVDELKTSTDKRIADLSKIQIKHEKEVTTSLNDMKLTLSNLVPELIEKITERLSLGLMDKFSAQLNEKVALLTDNVNSLLLKYQSMVVDNKHDIAMLKKEQELIDYKIHTGKDKKD